MSALLLALIAPANAVEPALTTAGWTLGGEVTGALVGGAAGVGVGAALCRNDGGWECWLPLIGGAVGVVGGGLAGGITGSAVGAHRAGLDAAPVVAATGLTATAGLGLVVAGAALGSSPVQMAGLLVGAAGMPVAAAVSVGRAEVAVLPGPGSVTLAARF